MTHTAAAPGGEWPTTGTGTDHGAGTVLVVPQDFRYLGKPSPTSVDDLDVLELSGPVDVRFHSEELTAVCPVTDQPDFYRADIDLFGSTVTIESKSLKLYLRTWDGVGILAEELAIAVADRVWAAAGGRAERVVVTLVQARRGGIDTTVTVTRS